MTIPQQTSSSPVDVLAQTESFRTLDCPTLELLVGTANIDQVASGRIGQSTLEEVAEFCQVELWKRHTAYGDAVMTALMFKWLGERLTHGRHPVSKLIKWQTQVGFFN